MTPKIFGIVFLSTLILIGCIRYFWSRKTKKENPAGKNHVIVDRRHRLKVPKSRKIHSMSESSKG